MHPSTRLIRDAVLTTVSLTYLPVAYGAVARTTILLPKGRRLLRRFLTGTRLAAFARMSDEVAARLTSTPPQRLPFGSRHTTVTRVPGGTPMTVKKRRMMPFGVPPTFCLVPTRR